jgi:hypothetical protein
MRPCADLLQAGQEIVDLLERVQLLQLAGLDAGLVLSDLQPFHPLQVGDQGGQLAGVVVGMVVPDVPVDAGCLALLQVHLAP